MRMCKRGLVLLVLTLLAVASVASAGQRKVVEDDSAFDAMTIEEIRAYQAYFYASGGRDPLVMRFPTLAEIGQKETGGSRVPTLEELRAFLQEYVEKITAALRIQNYADAIAISDEAIEKIDGEWAEGIKSEHTDLIRMVDEIRSYNRMALTLKRNQDIKKEFLSLQLRVDGVVWSPIDSKAVINGRTYSAGELLTNERKQGDLRIEVIDEFGVVFQFQGIRFHLPVEVYAPPNNTGDL